MVTDFVMDWLDKSINALKSETYTWPTFPRRLYVLTWPVSAVIRWTVWIFLLFAFLIVGSIGFTIDRLIYIWKGERSPWN